MNAWATMIENICIAMDKANVKRLDHQLGIPAYRIQRIEDGSEPTFTEGVLILDAHLYWSPENHTGIVKLLDLLQKKAS